MAIYLDYCATTPVDPRVLDVMIDVYRNNPGNADSRTHVFGTRAKEIVMKARKTLAEILRVDPTEVIFTSGATESDNTAILGLRKHAEETDRKHIITTAIEHKAVLEAARKMQSDGFDVDFVKPESSGRVNPDKVLSLVRPDTLLVSIMHVNNETGVIQPVKELGDALWGTDVLFHVDAAQSFGKLNDEIRDMKYDMLSISGHKIHGPQGIGLLILRRKNYRRPPVSPLLYGGQQEYGFRPGTTPVALVAGLAEAAQLMDAEYPKIESDLKRVKDDLLALAQEYHGKTNGDQEYVLPNILNISFPGVDAEAFFAAEKEEYAVSNGSACTSGSYKPSYVLEAMGLDETRISEALRISWWREKFDLKSLESYIQDCQ